MLGPFKKLFYIAGPVFHINIQHEDYNSPSIQNSAAKVEVKVTANIHVIS